MNSWSIKSVSGVRVGVGSKTQMIDIVKRLIQVFSQKGEGSTTMEWRNWWSKQILKAN